MLNTDFRGWKVVSIHGDKSQNDRTKSLSLFKKGSCPLMVSCFILLLIINSSSLFPQKSKNIYELKLGVALLDVRSLNIYELVVLSPSNF